MKIMVVDDEPLINQYIVQCIRGADVGAEVVASVTSGAKALKKLEDTPVELVLVDITMPKMDGIELLKEIKARYPATDVVMLTCHDDFAYARAAIQNQASDYILKSEVSVELIRSLLEKLRNNQTGRIADQAAGHISRNHYLRRLIEGDTSVLPIRESDLRKYHIYLADRAFIALFFRNDTENLVVMQNCLGDGFENPLFYAYSEKTMFLLLNLRRDDGHGQNVQTPAYFRTLARQMSGVVGCSRLHHHLEALPDAIREAVSDRDRQFYQTADAVRPGASDVAQIEQYIMRALVKIESGSVGDGCAEIERLIDCAAQSHPQVSFLKESMIQLFSCIQDKLGWSFGKIGEQLENSRCFSEFCAYINASLESLRSQGKLYSVPIRKALDYIGFHYAEDISLNMVADFVYLNRDYLSRQFKKEVGVNFSEYLMTLRMNRAKHLLETTNLRISDIALSVGMTNMSYFSTVFHRSFGCAPNEARKRTQER